MSHPSILSVSLNLIFTPEQELLLLCSRTFIDKKVLERIQTLLESEINWDLLIELASKHGVTPLLYLSIKLIDSSKTPPLFLRQLYRAFQKNVHQSLILTQELLRLLDILQGHNIQAIPFKGPVLASSVYGKLSLRQMNDLDILVNAWDIDRAADLIKAEGYELQIEVPWERHLVREPYNVDLHQMIAPEHLSASLTNQEIWQKTQPFCLNGQVVPNLIPEATLLMLCLHGTKECWSKLNRISDVAELVRSTPQLDWSQFIEQSKCFGRRRLILVGLGLANDLLDAPLSEAIRQQVKSDKAVQKLITQIKQELFVNTELIGEVERSLFHIRFRERWLDKLHVLQGLLEHSGWFKPTENDKEILPLPGFLNFLYYFLRPIRILVKYGFSPLKQ